MNLQNKLPRIQDILTGLTHIERGVKLLCTSEDSQDGSPDGDELLDNDGRNRPRPVDTQNIQELQK